MLAPELGVLRKERVSEERNWSNDVQLIINSLLLKNKSPMVILALPFALHCAQAYSGVGALTDNSPHHTFKMLHIIEFVLLRSNIYVFWKFCRTKVQKRKKKI